MKSINSLDTPEQKVDLVNAGPNWESIRLQMVSKIYWYAAQRTMQREHSFMFNSSRFASFWRSGDQSNPINIHHQTAERTPQLHPVHYSGRLFHNSTNSQWAAKRHRSKKNLPSQSEFLFKRIVGRCAGAGEPEPLKSTNRNRCQFPPPDPLNSQEGPKEGRQTRSTDSLPRRSRQLGGSHQDKRSGRAHLGEGSWGTVRLGHDIPDWVRAWLGLLNSCIIT